MLTGDEWLSGDPPSSRSVEATLEHTVTAAGAAWYEERGFSDAMLRGEEVA